jgi:hypothetical protein
MTDEEPHTHRAHYLALGSRMLAQHDNTGRSGGTSILSHELP